MYVYAQTYVVLVRTAHEYARTRTRDSANMGGQNLQILKLVTSFCIYGGGGRGNWGTGEVVV